MSEIDIGQIVEALNDKSDRDLRNVDTTAKADAVTDYQEPTSANGYTWYRKYKSGWVEQGGKITSTIGTSDTAWSTNLIVAMSNNQYFVSVCAFGYAGHNIINPEGQTSTVLKGYATSNVSSSKTILWYVSGMAAN